jgi:hypothetical protein
MPFKMKPLSFVVWAVFVGVIAGITFKAPVYSVPRNGERFKSSIADMTAEESVKSPGDSRHIQQLIMPDTDKEAWKNSDVTQEVRKEATGVSPISAGEIFPDPSTKY